jgi:hypothetical protein
MEIKRGISEVEVLKIIPVLLQLREQYTAEGLYATIVEQMKQGYELTYVESNGRLSVLQSVRNSPGETYLHR